MKIGVGGAAYFSKAAHIYHAVETLDSFKSEKHDIEFAFFLNSPAPNGVEELSRYGRVFANERNNVSRAWNRSIDFLLNQGCKYVIVPNLDIILKEDAVDNLVSFAERTPEHILWTGQNWHYLGDDQDAPGIMGAPTPDHSTPNPHFSCFMVDDRLFDKIGPFDEAFEPAYNEDLDMHWRIRLAGESAACYEGARFYHYGSRTIKLDAALNAENERTHRLLDGYFGSKWSYKPPTANDPFTEGMFKFPWNDPSRVGAEKSLTETWSTPLELTSK